MYRYSFNSTRSKNENIKTQAVQPFLGLFFLTMVVIGKMTASADEDIVIAFKNRTNAKIIGEESYGFLTANDMEELPFNVSMAGTTGYIVDSKGGLFKNYYARNTGN